MRLNHVEQQRLVNAAVRLVRAAGDYCKRRALRQQLRERFGAAFDAQLERALIARTER